MALESGSIKVKVVFEFEHEESELGTHVNEAIRRFLHNNHGRLGDDRSNLVVLLESLETKGRWKAFAMKVKMQ